ncbi:uncharacterized protein RSE6_04604 [Rhynchosporium secalis]|uniref:Uncharacterized protein n=1 Tax=Rhynchosporium secalis TaxID=38038 RepID=A0A1E1M5P7_RHYSE|nr:uncharacterized protein RSE6_04604 [Rhynchosporium secalis]
MEGRELRLGRLRGLDGETYDTCASFEKQGSKLRIKVLDSATQKRFDSKVAMHPFKLITFKKKLMDGYQDYLKNDDPRDAPVRPNRFKKLKQATNPTATYAEYGKSNKEEDSPCYLCTLIRNSKAKISKVGYKNFSSTAEDFVWDFITGNLLPNGETENGVSRAQAVVSAFFRLGYRVNMLSAYDAPRDVKNGNFISVLKPKMRIKPQSKLLERSTQMGLATVY